MKSFLSVVVLIAFSGCLTLLTDTRKRNLKRYEIKNPDVPAEILSAMHNEKIVRGMTMEQVKLAWGKPGKMKVIPSKEGQKETVWYYYDEDGKVSGMKATSLFAVDVPSKRVNFDGEGKLEVWKIYDEEIETSRSTALTKTLPTSVLGGSRSDGVLRAGSYKDWPYIVLSAVVGNGQDAAAVLNGRVVRVGGAVKGVKLLAVGTHGVKLEYKKQVGILKKGESTQ